MEWRYSHSHNIQTEFRSCTGGRLVVRACVSSFHLFVSNLWLYCRFCIWWMKKVSHCKMVVVDACRNNGHITVNAYYTPSIRSMERRGGTEKSILVDWKILWTEWVCNRFAIFQMRHSHIHKCECVVVPPDASANYAETSTATWTSHSVNIVRMMNRSAISGNGITILKWSINWEHNSSLLYAAEHTANNAPTPAMCGLFSLSMHNMHWMRMIRHRLNTPGRGAGYIYEMHLRRGQFRWELKI